MSDTITPEMMTVQVKTFDELLRRDAILEQIVRYCKEGREFMPGSLLHLLKSRNLIEK